MDSTRTTWTEIWRRELPCLSPGRRLVVRLAACLAAPWVRLPAGLELGALPEPAILVFNHNNTFECALLPPLLVASRGGRPVHFLLDWMYLRVPVLGSVLRVGEPIPVYGKRARWGLWEAERRGPEGYSPLARALACLGAGESVGIFPEGRRNRDAGALLRPRRGLGHLILGSAAPVVPIGLHFPAAERLGRAPRLGRMQVEVGPTLDFTAERELARRQEGSRRELLTGISARVMAQLAALSRKSSSATKESP